MISTARGRVLVAALSLSLATARPAAAASNAAPAPIPSAQPAAASAELHLDAPDPLASVAPPDLSTFAWRHGQLGLHQGMGLATLGTMALTTGLGYYYAQVAPVDAVRDTHLAMAGLTTGLYVSSALLALAVPPGPVAPRGGAWDTVSWHKNLGWLHAAGLAATVGLGLATVYGGTRFAPYHEVAGFSTLGLMAVSAGVIAFGE